MTEYKANSHRSKANNTDPVETKKIEPVVNGVKKKKSSKKFSDVFATEDINGVAEYLLTDVLIPAIKNTMFDLGKNALDMWLFGGKGGGSRKSGSSNPTYVSYTKYSERDYRPDRTVRSSYSYDDLIFENREQARDVLDTMLEMLDKYRVVTVMDMFELCNERCDYTANKYGWTNLRNAEVVRVRDGYIIKLPKAMPID